LHSQNYVANTKIKEDFFVWFKAKNITNSILTFWWAMNYIFRIVFVILLTPLFFILSEEIIVISILFFMIFVFIPSFFILLSKWENVIETYFENVIFKNYYKLIKKLNYDDFYFDCKKYNIYINTPLNVKRKIYQTKDDYFEIIKK
jgi:hypothetical protein